ncbi:hypothetical protein [Actinomadura sp. WMMB 499]|uniref:hypothetical protein n=1 Tax=Actinomadura sp. WMMB 499 TaxID=1219491 RepID=UPI00124651D5|nr:hypothetical protein [Actinomadura sp. WMMB 499]QFG21111.1 hypothetical protein F7P10_08130 [Actinomadura sp. WMMB 499]
MEQVDGPFYHVVEPTFELLIPQWEGHDPLTQQEADATIILPDGSRYYGTFMTPDAITAVMQRWQSTGECLSGSYFWCTDLIIIHRPGIPAIVEAVRDLIDSGELSGACAILEPENLRSG